MGLKNQNNRPSVDYKYRYGLFFAEGYSSRHAVAASVKDGVFFKSIIL